MTKSERGDYFDLQVNGYAGVDFNDDDLAGEALERACQQLAADGVSQILATIITDELEVMERRLRRLAELRSSSELMQRIVAGIHVEGPFISGESGYVGAHPAGAVRQASRTAASRLIDAGQGLVRLVTLAPECDEGAAVTKWLADQGVRVAAGHCNPSLEDLRRAIDAGLSMFTHLGNGCPLLLPRHDNIIQRVLSLADSLWICFIADGVHVPLVALRNYLKVVGPERAIVVSDAIAAAGMGPGRYTLGGQNVVVDERLATWAADRSHLVGSACTMRQAADNLLCELSLPPAVIHQLTAANPRTALGLPAAGA